MIVLLHNIRSAHNVGSIFRTADAAGCEKIYLCGITPAPVDKYNHPVSRLTKVSLGAEKYIPWEKVKSIARLIDKLKKQAPKKSKLSAGQRYKIIAIEQSPSSIPYYKFNIDTLCHPEFISGSRTKKSLLTSLYKREELPPFEEGGWPARHRLRHQALAGGGGFKIVLILGNELNGLPPVVLKRAEKILEIPMKGKKESLNVAVAFGIIAFHLLFDCATSNQSYQL